MAVILDNLELDEDLKKLKQVRHCSINFAYIIHHCMKVCGQ